MVSRFDSLCVDEVIGDMLDQFTPEVEITIDYGGYKIRNGHEMDPCLLTFYPTVKIGGNPESRYTMVMVDLDAPNSREPTQRELIHWLVVNIPGKSNVDREGTEVLMYKYPIPTGGAHRFVFALFKQMKQELNLEPPERRTNFSTRRFAFENDLGNPVGATFYICEIELEQPINNDGSAEWKRIKGESS